MQGFKVSNLVAASLGAWQGALRAPQIRNGQVRLGGGSCTAVHGVDSEVKNICLVTE
jgi:hypothetical protein